MVIQLITLKKLLLLFLLSLIPTVEPRYAIPLAISSEVPPEQAVLLGTIAVVVLSVFVTNFYDVLDAIFSKVLGKTWIKIRDNSRKKLSNYLSKYGKMGLVIFVLIPLPGSGIWTGAMVARFLGMEKRDVMIYSTIGGFLSMILVSLGLNFGIT